MRSCFYQYRKGLFEALSTIVYNGAAVPVYQYPPMNVAAPYILIADMDAFPLEDKTVFSQQVTTEIHVVTEFVGDFGGSVTADAILDLVMDLLITKGVTVGDRAKLIDMDDFEQTTCVMQDQRYINEFDGQKKTVRSVLSINSIIDEL